MAIIAEAIQQGRLDPSDLQDNVRKAVRAR